VEIFETVVSRGLLWVVRALKSPKSASESIQLQTARLFEIPVPAPPFAIHDHPLLPVGLENPPTEFSPPTPIEFSEGKGSNHNPSTFDIENSIFDISDAVQAPPVS